MSIDVVRFIKLKATKLQTVFKLPLSCDTTVAPVSGLPPGIPYSKAFSSNSPRH